MFKALLWLCVVILAVIIFKRFVNGLVGVFIFLGAIFFSIFMLDTFTVVNVRDFANISFYDKTVENPKESLDKTTKFIKKEGEKVVVKINETGDKLDKKYNKESIVEIENIEDIQQENTLQEDKQKEVKPVKKSDTSKKNSEEEIPQLEGYSYIPFKKHQEVFETYQHAMTKKDKEIYKALSPFITFTFNGENFTFHTVQGLEGFYVKQND